MTDRRDVTAIVLAGGRSARFGSSKLEALVDGERLLDRAVRAVSVVAARIVVAGPASPTSTEGHVPTGPVVSGLPAVPSVPAESAETIDATIRFVPDDEPFAGPLAAIAGVLRMLGSDVTLASDVMASHVTLGSGGTLASDGTLAPSVAIVVGGDMPALAPAVLEAMLARLALAADIDAVVLEPDPKTANEAPKTQVLPLALRVAPASIAAAEALNAGDRSLLRLLDRLRSIVMPAPEWLALDPIGGTLLDVDIPADLEHFRARDFQ